MINDYEEKYNDLINVIADIRSIILELTPSYDQYLCEMVSCPHECTLIIKQWVDEQSKRK